MLTLPLTHDAHSLHLPHMVADIPESAKGHDEHEKADNERRPQFRVLRAPHDEITLK